MSAVLEAREPSAKYLSTLQPPLVQQFDLLATAPGGVARLRELILTLAVQGKLVPQDAQDEPANELLRRIRVERDRLVAEGRIRRDKPQAKIAANQWPFELPRTWAWERFGDVTLVSSGVTLGRKTVMQEPVSLPYLRVANVQRWHVALESVKEVVVDRSELDRFQIRSGDLLITEGGDWDKVGRTAIWRDELPMCLHQNHVFKARGFNVEWNALWAQLYLNSAVARSYFASSAKQTTNLASINMTELKACAFPVPPLAEQSRIVTRVEELMRLCDALEAKGQLEAAQHAQLVQTLLGALTSSATPEELADNWQRVATHFDLLLDRPEAIDALEQAILQLAVRGLLVPQDPKDEPAGELLKKIRAEKDHLIADGKIKRDKPMEPVAIEDVPFVLPKGWSWVRFDELIHPLKPIAYGVLVPGPDVEAGVPFVRIADLSIDNPAPMPEKSIGRDIDSQFQRTRLEGGEILMGVVGSIGKLGVAPPTWAGANIARAICRIVPADSGLREFVLFLLQTEFMQQSFVGDTRTLAQPTLNVGLIRQALTPVPPPAEQARIVACVGLLRRHCAELRQRLTASQTTQAHLAEALIDEVT